MIRQLIFSLLLLCFFITAVYAGWNMTEDERRIQNDKYDKLKLRQKTDFVTDKSEKMLVQPAEEDVIDDFTIAKVPPTIRMIILPDMLPEYFPENAENAAWANWGKVTRSEDNRFFFSVGDHRGIGCQINIYEYNPARNIVHTVLDVDKLLGWTDQSYTDGKIHGRMGIMPDGTLWAATHYGVYPDSTWWANGYRGSWLLSYNIYTHEAKNWGIPLVGQMLPEFNLDAKRGKLVGTGANKTILCWDTINKKVTYAGCPPNGWEWWQRAMLLDEETGIFWTTCRGDEKHRFLNFDPELNKFRRFELSPPENPYDNKVTQLRGYTERRAMDGAFYCITHNGTMFRFFPEVPKTELVGVNWDKGRYTSTTALSPDGRYIYYLPGGKKMQNANEYGPVLQYDVKTGRKKVIAWLADYYWEKYGYWVGGTYGMEISGDGSYLVICMNGAFVIRDDENGSPYGNPSLFVVNIPEEERSCR
ncbi:MAG: hypothetical protein JXB48_16990 [Candidatus Latescibacteria bacterium]|nr:hypothetical protein [Candidatus Latescibacterota bacterium]